VAGQSFPYSFVLPSAVTVTALVVIVRVEAGEGETIVGVQSQRALGNGIDAHILTGRPRVSEPEELVAECQRARW